MSEKKAVVKVTIGGDEYTLRSDRAPEYTRAVAEHVDRSLRDVLAMSAIVETHKAAILTALSITDELFQARQQQRELAGRLNRLTAELARLLPPSKRGAAGAFASSVEQA